MESYLRSFGKFMAESARTEAVVTLAVMLTLGAVGVFVYIVTGDLAYQGLALVLSGFALFQFGLNSLKLDYLDECAGKKSPRYTWHLPVIVVGFMGVYMGYILLSQMGLAHLQETFTKLATRRLF